MKTSSCKAKGRNLQKLMRDKIRETFPELKASDVESTSMGASGEDVKLSSRALELFPFAVESKSYKKFAVYPHFEQAQTHAEKLAKKNEQTVLPLLVIKQNRSKPLVILDLEDFFNLLLKK